jgi:citronellol/citronellal dehydrogenase
MTSATLRGRTAFITGASRGIGLAIAKRLAADGANIAFIAKSSDPDPRLPGTIHTAAEEIEAAGGRALALLADVRDDDAVQGAVQATAERFGGIDILVNNASAINLGAIDELPMKRYDLLQQVNTRGTYLATKTCLPYLDHAANPHVLTLSPPLDLRDVWFAPATGYTISKYGMSMCTLGFARQLAPRGIAVNSLWPRTVIGTAAVRNLLGGETSARRGRRPEIVADAAHEILTRPATEYTGQFAIDEDVLREAGRTDFSQYLVDETAQQDELLTDFYLPGGEQWMRPTARRASALPPR